MPEAQTYSDFRRWLITRKASSATEVRDWYTEYSNFVNQIDQDVDNLAPKGHVLVSNAAGSSVDNGTWLVNAYAEAKTLSPSATKRIKILLQPGVYQVTSQLVLDTDYIDLYCPEGAIRTQWGASPSWSEVERAGAKIFISGSGTVAPVKITAQHVRITGVDFEGVNSGGTPLFGCVVDLTTHNGPAPLFENCSFAHKGVNLVQSGSRYGFINCHTEEAFCGYAEGYYNGCSCCSEQSFSKAGKTVKTLVENCLIKSNYNNSVEEADMDDVMFFNCGLYSSDIMFLYSSGDPCTDKTIFEQCYGEFETLFDAPEA